MRGPGQGRELGENRGKEKLQATAEPSKGKDRSGRGSVDGVGPNKLCASRGGPGGWQFQQHLSLCVGWLHSPLELVMLPG